MADVLTAPVVANVIAIGAAVAAFLAWRSAHQQAQIATRAEETAKRSLQVAYRPYVSIAIYPFEGTGPDLINFVSVFHNHGNVPATVNEAWARVAGSGDLLGAGAQLQPNQIPSQLCLFPGQEGELTWGVTTPRGGFIQILVELGYRGAFDTKYTTRLEVSYPMPEGHLTQRAASPMDVRRAEAT
jgi:hypothetical protein